MSTLFNGYSMYLVTPDGQYLVADSAAQNANNSCFIFHLDPQSNRGYPAGSIFQIRLIANAMTQPAPGQPIKRVPCQFRQQQPQGPDTSYWTVSVDEFVPVDDYGRTIPYVLPLTVGGDAQYLGGPPAVPSITESYSPPSLDGLIYTTANTTKDGSLYWATLVDPAVGTAPVFTSHAGSGAPGNIMSTMYHDIPKGIGRQFVESYEYYGANDPISICSAFYSTDIEQKRKPCMPTQCGGDFPVGSPPSFTVVPMVAQCSLGFEANMAGLNPQAQFYLNGVNPGVTLSTGDFGNGMYLVPLYQAQPWFNAPGSLTLVLKGQSINNCIPIETIVTFNIVTQTGGGGPTVVNCKPGPVDSHIGDWTTGVALPVQIQMINTDAMRFSPELGNFAAVNTYLSRNGSQFTQTTSPCYEVPNSPGEWYTILTAQEMAFVGTGRVLFIGFNTLGQEVPHSVATFNAIYARHVGQTIRYGPFWVNQVNPGVLSFFMLDPDGLPNVPSTIYSVITKNGQWPVFTTYQPIPLTGGEYTLTLTENEVDTPGPCMIYVTAAGNTSEGADTWSWPIVQITFDVDVSSGPPLMCFEGTYDPSKLPLTLSFGQFDAANWLYSGVPDYWLCTLYAPGPVINPNIPRPVELSDHQGIYQITLSATDLVGVSGTFMIAIGGNRSTTDGTWPGQVLILMEPSAATGVAPAPPPGGSTVNVTPTSINNITSSLAPQFSQLGDTFKQALRDLLGNQMTNKPTWQRTT